MKLLNIPQLALPDCAPLWRYTPLNTLLLHLQGKCFLPSIAKLQDCDAREGSPICQTEWMRREFADSEWPEVETQLCTLEDKEAIKANSHDPEYVANIVLRRYFDFINQTRFAWCWYQSNYESAAMWQLYGRGGVAVKSSAASLSAALEAQAREFLISRVAYFDRAGRPLV